MQPSTAKLLFLAYSALTGITFSILPLAYGFGTMFIAFGFTALMFGSMAVIGMTTKKDLSGLGPILMAGSDHDDRDHDCRLVYQSGRHFDGDELYHDRNFPGPDCL